MNLFKAIIQWLARHRILSFAAVLIIAASGIWLQRFYSRAQGTLSEPLKRGTIAEAVYGIGTINANQSLQIRPGQVSHIDRYFCREGDHVKRGAPLVVLDGVTWRAPFEGTITSLPFKTGENVYAQGPILTLTDLNDRYMTVSLEQQGALRVKPGNKVKVSFDTLRGESYEGVVRTVYSNDNNFLARIDIESLPARILPGMTADAAIIIRVQNDVLLLPVAALVDEHAWVKRDRSAPVLVAVKTGIIDRDLAEVVAGDLREGDRVLIKGSAKK